MDEAESSDSNRRTNQLCRLSRPVQFRCAVGSTTEVLTMYCGRVQRFRRSEQVAATVVTRLRLTPHVDPSIFDWWSNIDHWVVQ